MTTITTKYKTTGTGAGRIVATGQGKQRTITFDYSKSVQRLHGEAAGTLALALGLRDGDNITHKVGDDGKHKFVWN